MIVAKPVIPDRYWILKQDDQKVGNIEIDPHGGFQVKINNQVQKFKTVRNIKQRVKIDFESAPKTRTVVDVNQVHGYPTESRPYNAIYDVKHRLPLYTQDPRSKSWYAAGWYRVRHGRSWSVNFCPKLITLQRYQYQGPFQSEQAAQQ